MSQHNLLLDRTSQCYGIRTLCPTGDHPYKAPHFRLLSKKSAPQTDTGLQRIADLLPPLLSGGPPLEDLSDHMEPPMSPPEIGLYKAKQASAHKI